MIIGFLHRESVNGSGTTLVELFVGISHVVVLPNRLGASVYAAADLVLVEPAVELPGNTPRPDPVWRERRRAVMARGAVEPVTGIALAIVGARTGATRGRRVVHPLPDGVRADATVTRREQRPALLVVGRVGGAGRLVVAVAGARPTRPLRVRVPGATVTVVRAGRRRSRTCR